MYCQLVPVIEVGRVVSRGTDIEGGRVLSVGTDSTHTTTWLYLVLSGVYRKLPSDLSKLQIFRRANVLSTQIEVTLRRSLCFTSSSYRRWNES